MRASFRTATVWLAAGVSAMAVGVAGSGSAQDATNVSPVTVQGTGVPRIGEQVRMWTPLEIRLLATDAGAFRDRFEDDRAEIYSCYQKAYGLAPNAERVDPYIEGSEAARRLSVAAGDAVKATEAMEALQSGVQAGRATQAQLDVAELARQAAVKRMERANSEVEEAKRKIIDVQYLAQTQTPIQSWSGVMSANAAERASRRNPLVPRAVEDMALTEVRTVLRGEGAAAFLVVSGKITNNGRSRSDIPALTFTAQDGSGRALKSDSVSAPGKIEPGASTTFSYSFKPGLAGAARVSVTFEAMNRQPSMQPVSSDPVCANGSAAPAALNPRMNANGRMAQASGRTNQLEDPATVNLGNGNQAVTQQPVIRPTGGAP